MEAPSRRRVPGNVCSALHRRTEEERGEMEEKRGKVRTDGDSREAMARKQRGERHTEQQKTGREGQGDSSEDQAGGTWAPPGVQFLCPRTGQSCLAPAHLAFGAWPGVSGQQRRSFKGRRNPSRSGCRHPGPGAGSVPASGPERRAGLRSGMGQSLRAAAVSSGS